VPDAPEPDAAQLFAGLSRALADERGVTLPAADGSARRFGADALKVDERIFAMVSGEAVVLKLPARRVSELLASGEGRPFDAGKGRPMREWVALAAPDADACLALAREALAFVREVGRRV
jgi:hypothetical protein